MSKEEARRLEVLVRLRDGLLTAREASEILGLSERQVRRILAAYREEGAAGLAHGNRGRKPLHTVSDEDRKRVLELAATKYQGYNHQHLSEVLASDGIERSRATVRRILMAAGLRSPKKRRSKKHRQRRERYAQEGMLIQVDGSKHDWLEGRGPWLTLMLGIDDATGKLVGGVFREQEDAQGYMLLMREIVTRHGIPLAIYRDGHGTFERSKQDVESIDEQLTGSLIPTQFGRVLEELSVQSIHAHSPQAKGRIERSFGTLQDRLVKALRAAGASTLAEANVVLPDFLQAFSDRFSVTPADPNLAYREPPKSFRPDEVFCFKYLRSVSADNTVQFFRRRIQIQPSGSRSSYARLRVEVHERLDGSIAIYHGGSQLASVTAPADPKPLRARGGPRPSASSSPASPPSPDEGPFEASSPIRSASRPTPASTAPSCSRAEGSPVPPGTTPDENRGDSPTPTTEARPSASASTENGTAINHIDKWTGKPVHHQKPAPNHPWRTPIKQTG